MSLWKTREEALAHPELVEVHRILETGLGLIDDGLRLLELSISNDLARTAGGFLLKGKCLVQSCYSLALDGHGQESGALLRPLLEVLEVSKYLRTVPDGIQRAQEDRLPEAGKIAAKVGSSFKKLRESLNDTASHIGLNYDSMHHLFRFRGDELSFTTIQPFILTTTRTNLVMIGVFVKELLDEVMLTVEAVYDGCPDELINHAEQFRQHLIKYHEQWPGVGT